MTSQRSRVFRSFPRLSCVFAMQLALAIAIAANARRVAHLKPNTPESEQRSSTQLAWVDHRGVITDSYALHGHYVAPRIALTTGLVLLTRVEPGTSELWSVWVSGQKSERLFHAPGRSAFALPEVEGAGIIFSRWQENRGLLLELTSGRAPRPLLDYAPGEDWFDASSVPNDQSRMTGWIVFATRYGSAPTRLYLLRNASRRPGRLIASTADFHSARFSPDGQKLALVSNLSGQNEVYIVPVPSNTAELPLSDKQLVRISDHGGCSPEWASNGDLFYLSDDGDLMSSDLQSPPRKLFHALTLGAPDYEYRFGGYCPERNGNRILFVLGDRFHEPKSTDLRSSLNASR